MIDFLKKKIHKHNYWRSILSIRFRTTSSGGIGKILNDQKYADNKVTSSIVVNNNEIKLNIIIKERKKI